MTDEIDACKVCGVVRRDHDNSGKNHQFSERGELIPVKKPEKKKDQRVVVQNSPAIPSGDPVLRMLLVNKGLITPQELEDTHEQLRAMGVLIAHDHSTGHRSGDSSTG